MDGSASDIDLNGLVAVRDVTKYKQHVKECRDLAARTTRPNERKILEDISDQWEKLAALREHDLIDPDD
jgi:hypothetical protein